MNKKKSMQSPGQHAGVERDENKTGYVKDTFLWPFLAGVITYSLKGPSPPVIFFVFITALLILAVATDIEKYVVCGAIIFFQFLNGLFVYYGTQHQVGPLLALPELWIANRLLYVVGLAFFLPPLVEPFMNTDRRRTVASIAACVCIFAAHLTFSHERFEKDHSTVRCEKIIGDECTPEEKPEVWYAFGALVDDALLGLAAGLLFAAMNGNRGNVVPGARNRDS
jgi:hypothetical protein